MMKKYVFAAVALVSTMGNSFAANPFDSACRDMAESSFSIMELRQQGLQQSTLTALLQEATNKDKEMDAETREIVNTYITDIIARAYKVEKFKSTKDQQKAAADFKVALQKDCESRLKNLFK